MSQGVQHVRCVDEAGLLEVRRDDVDLRRGVALFLVRHLGDHVEERRVSRLHEPHVLPRRPNNRVARSVKARRLVRFLGHLPLEMANRDGHDRPRGHVVHVHRGRVEIGGQRAQKLDVYDANPILDRQNWKVRLLHHTSQTRSVQAALLVRSAVLRNNVQDLGGEVVHSLFFSQKGQL